MHNAQSRAKGQKNRRLSQCTMHNYEQKVLLIHDSASPLPELKHGAFYNDVPTAQTLSCARGYVKTSPLRG